ncbi:MAG TPA: phosphate ABC transporter substrate-binding protein PstS, partial [Candidatus Binatus sp.]|nr:phosphate ABC transporter substrate-binding protein PstS [Candidatus Binatus sp.]
MTTQPISRRPGMVSRTMFILGLIIVAAIAGGLGYYLGGALKPAPNTNTVYSTLNGAGATFPYPLLSAMSLNYSRQYPNIQINYNAIGSGGGINALIQKTVDFAASDAPLSNTQRSQATNSLHIPETIGAVVAAYNYPGVPTGLNMTGQVLAQIFQGNITSWNDPQIKNLNPGVASILQTDNKPLVYVHRSDGSGTTFIFTKYLNSTDPGTCSTCWRLGVGTAIGTWPGNNLGASGNAGVAGVIQGTKYT